MYEPIEIAPETPKPRLPGHVGVYPTMDEIIDAVGADLLVQAHTCVRTFGDFHLALSGSPVLDGLYRRLMYDPSYRELPWTRTHLWMADEGVPEGNERHPRRTLVREWIVDNSGIPVEQVHAIDVDRPQAAREYEGRLAEMLGWREKGHDRPDFVVLAIEPQGLAALHPPDSGGSTRFVHQIASPLPGNARFSLSPELIRASRCVAVVAAGEAGAAGVRSLGGRARLEGIRPVGGELRWYLDAGASDQAARLSEK